MARKVEGRMTPVSAAKPAEAKVSAEMVVILISEMVIILIIEIIAMNATTLILSKPWFFQHDPDECLLS